MAARFDMIGLGYCGTDISCLVGDLPIDGKVEALGWQSRGGGPAATATYTSAILGSKSAFAGVVGDDSNGTNLVAEFAGAGVDTSHILRRKGATTATAVCIARQQHNSRSIVWTRGDSPPLAINELDEDWIRSCRLLHLDGHQPAAAQWAASQCKRAGIPVAIDAGTVLPGVAELLELCDIVIASEAFALEYTGEDNWQQSVSLLWRPHRRFVAVTRGAAGVVGFDGERYYQQPAFSVDVVDTTGAGDVFHGAFNSHFLGGANWSDCLKFAAAAAACKCQALGGRLGIPSRTQLESFMAHHHEKT
jgi:sulfofructose kinase